MVSEAKFDRSGGRLGVQTGEDEATCLEKFRPLCHIAHHHARAQEDARFLLHGTAVCQHARTFTEQVCEVVESERRATDDVLMSFVSGLS